MFEKIIITLLFGVIMFSYFFMMSKEVEYWTPEEMYFDAPILPMDTDKIA